jgi:hypothetical protein
MLLRRNPERYNPQHQKEGDMKKSFLYFLTIALGLAFISTSPSATSAEDFYKGKTIRPK